MKHSSFIGAFLSLAIILSGAAIYSPAFAQNYTSGNMVSQDEYYDWLQSDNSTLKKRVGRLDKDPVAELPLPILFGVALSDLSPNFGDARGAGRTHEGEDIMAPKGAPIISPTDAVVLNTGTWVGGGNYVATANPGGERFVYMHLDWIAVKVGDVLEPGDLIGYAGDTGNASGGASHLHLEIRKNGPTDPFPRLKKEFSLAQKMEFVENMIKGGKTRDEDQFVNFLVTNYRAQFSGALALGIEIPEEIAAKMNGTPTTTTAPAAPAKISVPARDLKLGASGADVIWLQKFLVTAQSGPASNALAKAGSTGYFGSITKAALAEYQAKNKISPAAGYFGPMTRAYMTAKLKTP